ncbi:prepilin-type N-terminal cleavage/methylation domain-containing protein [Allochromatium palmeri]|uniref:Prepilin-type N-terminal cleavage/methylation domain-containing protein n=2 Tax=Allochromatium palmeri TaxID=231048 RepID=A0A6N8EHL1_9GAMM|nr:prepilin-type N-terminal cleavage/methylation domain-containing protein [Allochromatium palmeri]
MKSNHINRQGFTLIELLIVVAIIAILAAIAYPSYLDSVHKSRRSDAMAALSTAQLAQEKWRANNTTYGTLANIGINSDSPDQYYAITMAQSISNDTNCTLDANAPSATAYAIKATGQNGQENDTGCTAICVDETGEIRPAHCVSR